MPRYDEEQRAALSPYVTDVDADIYAIKGLPGIVGAAFARYSRAKGGLRDTMLNEFIKAGIVDHKHADELIDRVLIAFGDDSVGELEGAHMCLENISILSTKEIEDRRIGGSPIEQSTRYVFYDQRDDESNYRYHRPADIMASRHGSLYVETMDFIFSTYCELIEPMKAYFMQLKPIEAAEYDINNDKVKETLSMLTDEKDIKAFRMTYNMDIRTKACDVLRALLPLATKTNVGIFGNGRYFQYAISHCLTHPLPEVNDIARKTKVALDQIIPKYVKRAARLDYNAATHQRMQALAASIFASIPPRVGPGIHLLDDGEAAIAAALEARGTLTAQSVFEAMRDEKDVLTIAHMLFPYVEHPLDQVREVVRRMSPEERATVRKAYIGPRSGRRDRSGRAFEAGYLYTFDLMTSFGTYKDLERHRMTTQIRQLFTPILGFEMPEDLVAAGFADKAQACVEKAIALYNALKDEFPDAAQYATLHGSLVRWVLGMNDRAGTHMIELRTTPQGHPSYRKACQDMHREIAVRHPWRAEAMMFVDYGMYESARGDSEARQRAKEAALEQGAKVNV